eukprot:13435260-Alexandrium_andersonii.AAC.1
MEAPELRLWALGGPREAWYPRRATPKLGIPDFRRFPARDKDVGATRPAGRNVLALGLKSADVGKP